MSIQADVADAVTSELNLHAFSLTFTATRTQLPSYKRTETKELKVWVIPTSRKSEIKNHKTRGFTIQIDVGVGAPVSPEDNTAVDPYLDLLESIDDFLAFRELPTYTNAKWIGSETVDGADAGYAPDMLDANQYLGVIRATYRIC